MEIYGLKSCDTCKKAIKALPHATLKDVRNDGVPSGVLEAAFSKFANRLVNTRSTTWRGMSETERAAPPLEAIAAQPSLMKRPLIVNGSEMYLGWDAATRAALGVE
jgi:arsenate reductase